jgi:hypothetical protein
VVIEELEEMIENCESAQRKHRDLATAAVENYDRVTKAARAEYVAATAEWNRVRRLHYDGKLSTNELAAAAKHFASVRLVVESDYQMDKHAPHWITTPQPGPSYFMSHEVS